MRSFYFVFALGVLILGLQACGGGSAAPSPSKLPRATPASVAGNYTGTNVDSAHGRGIVTANIVQAGSSIGGGWSISYPGNPSPITSIIGTITGSQLVLSAPAQLGVPCAYAVTGTVAGKDIAGTYLSTNCGNSGTFVMTRP